MVSIPPWFDFARDLREIIEELEAVSIPPWFDFAVALAGENHQNTAVSIPPWFDFAAPCRAAIRSAK